MSNRVVVAGRRRLLGAAGLAIAASSAPAWTAAREENDVIFLTTEEFPFPEAVALARTVAAATGLRVRAMLPFGTAGWRATWGGLQYDAVTLVDLARPAIAQLKNTYGGSLFIILTTKDINAPDNGLRFLFIDHDAEPIAAISAARTIFAAQGTLASDDVVERLLKLALRTIALRYYRYERNTDIASILYSPLMSVDDLDRMGRKPFAQTTIGPAGFE